jgi:hypothetical protein
LAFKNFTTLFFIFFILLAPIILFAQQTELHGSVLDFYNRRPVEAVTVFTTSGKVAITDSAGKYLVSVSPKDSVWFSYLGKNTQRYPVDTINNFTDFEIALHIDSHWLPEVKVRNKNYLLDSLQNRKDYANVFNYRKPGLRVAETPASDYSNGGLSVGFDLDAIIQSFQFRKNREMLAFQNRLLNEEHDKYIQHRFNKYFVKQLTHLQSPELEKFMAEYKPSYELALQLNDLELGFYIEQCYKFYTRNRH